MISPSIICPSQGRYYNSISVLLPCSVLLRYLPPPRLFRPSFAFASSCSKDEGRKKEKSHLKWNLKWDPVKKKKMLYPTNPARHTVFQQVLDCNKNTDNADRNLLNVIAWCWVTAHTVKRQPRVFSDGTVCSRNTVDSRRSYKDNPHLTNGISCLPPGSMWSMTQWT